MSASQKQREKDLVIEKSIVQIKQLKFPLGDVEPAGLLAIPFHPSSFETPPQPFAQLPHHFCGCRARSKLDISSSSTLQTSSSWEIHVATNRHMAHEKPSPSDSKSPSKVRVACGPKSPHMMHRHEQLLTVSHH